ncbi:hypothetical protein [Phascolarctobacterium sp.]
MKIKATTPCYRFRDATPEEQIKKLKEELAEVESAYAEFKEMPTESRMCDLMMEIIDVKACCNTFVYQLRQKHRFAVFAYEKAKKQVISKNLARGYYSTPEDIDDMNTNKSEPF